MSWRTVLVEDGESLRLKLDSIIIEKNQKVFTIPLADISVIVVDGQQTTISTWKWAAALATAMKSNQV